LSNSLMDTEQEKFQTRGGLTSQARQKKWVRQKTLSEKEGDCAPRGCSHILKRNGSEDKHLRKGGAMTHWVKGQVKEIRGRKSKPR